MPPRISPAQLALRFGIEVTAFFGISAVTNAWWGRGAAIATLVAAGLVWSTFNVKDDPSRSGRAPVPVPGGVRLTLEVAVLCSGVAGLYLTHRYAIAITVGALSVVHYALTWSRVTWLLHREHTDRA